MKVIYLKDEYSLTETQLKEAQPNNIIINGENASMDAFFSVHGYSWKAGANGNTLFYRSESGKEYEIPQQRLHNTWQDEVRELIESTGLTMKDVAEKTNVPYRTIQEWRRGNRIADRLSMAAFRLKISELKNANSYWFRNNVVGNDIFCRNAESVEDAISQISENFNVVEILRTGETSKTTHNPNKVYVIYRGSKDTGYAVIIDR